MTAAKLPETKPECIEKRTNRGHLSKAMQIHRESVVRGSERDVVAMMWEYSNGYMLEWHHHERTQLLYPSTGVITVRTPESVWVGTPEKAVLLPAGVDHQVKMSGVVEIRSLFLSDSVVPNSTVDTCLVDISPMLRELLKHVMHIPHQYDLDGADGRLMQVILDQISLTPSQVIRLPQPEDEKIRWIERHLIENPADPRSLEDWAKELGTSSRTLTRRFRDDISISFREWRLRLRLVASIRSLAEGDSVAKTAHDVGFCSESAFIEQFKKATGKTPGRYFQKD